MLSIFKKQFFRKTVGNLNIKVYHMVENPKKVVEKDEHILLKSIAFFATLKFKK